MEHTLKNILKTEEILKFDASQPLSKVLPHFTSSHDAIFVFDDERFVGVVTPYYLIKDRSLTRKSKLKGAVIMPPKLSPDTTLSEVAQAMLESKIHYLPVLNEEGEFLGIATIGRLFNYIIRNQLFNHNGRIIFTNSELVTLTGDVPVSKALNLMANKKVAKLPIVDDHDHLIGFVSRYDLKDLVKESIANGKNNRKGERQSDLDEPVKNYMKKLVVTVNRIPSFTQAVELMERNKVGSLVIVDGNNKPLDIITKSDLLKTISSTSSL
ncbi:MAG: CBS domain-containing protein [Patescibacteria group bacterium]|jgi:CBS domain-containing protein